MVQQCYGDAEITPLNADGLQINMSQEWIAQVDSYGSPTNCNLLKVYGAKYLDIKLKADGSSGEIKIINEYWEMTPLLGIYFAGILILALTLLMKARSKISQNNTSDDFKSDPKIVGPNNNNSATNKNKKDAKNVKNDDKFVKVTKNSLEVSSTDASPKHDREADPSVTRRNCCRGCTSRIKRRMAHRLSEKGIHQLDVSSDLLYLIFISKFSLVLGFLMFLFIARSFYLTHKFLHKEGAT